MRRPLLRSRRAARRRGFTLVEVLVALGIVAIALTAGLKATAALTDNARRAAMQQLSPSKSSLLWDLWNEATPKLMERAEVPTLLLRYEDLRAILMDTESYVNSRPRRPP